MSLKQWEIDKERSDRYAKSARRFTCYSWPELLLCASKIKDDQQRSRDFVPTFRDVGFGYRALFKEIDTPGWYYDATVRWSRLTGAETERDKLPRGESNGMVYAYIDRNGNLARLVAVKTDLCLTKKKQDGGLILRTPWNSDGTQLGVFDLRDAHAAGLIVEEWCRDDYKHRSVILAMKGT